MKKKILSKGTAMVLSFAMLLTLASSVPVNAKETEELVAEEAIVTESLENVANNFSKLDSDAAMDVLERLSGDESILNSLTASGDQYEDNDSPETATTGRYNLVTYATIDSDDDMDWYEMDISDSSVPISIILTNIPANRDYDVYLIEYSSSTGYGDIYSNLEDGSVPEELIGRVNHSGTYYVVVMPNQTITNNYSDSNYKLYFGDYVRYKTYGYTSTGINIDFGYVKSGNTTPVYKYWYSYNLTNSNMIPDGALVDSIYLSSDGNGNSWIGFTKMLGYGTNTTLATKSGGINLMFSAEPNAQWYHEVKQNWLIGGYLTSSMYFTWQPKMRIDYMYGVTLDNVVFVQ